MIADSSYTPAPHSSGMPPGEAPRPARTWTCKHPKRGRRNGPPVEVVVWRVLPTGKYEYADCFVYGLSMRFMVEGLAPGRYAFITRDASGQITTRSSIVVQADRSLIRVPKYTPPKAPRKLPRPRGVL